MATRGQKRKSRDWGGEASEASSCREKIFPNEPLSPATKEDRMNWNGFCEVESEPAFFNVMLRELGVQGAKFQEVISLDDEVLGLLPQPIYGLVFLFRWDENQVGVEELPHAEGVWFANQTSPNSCATVAMLNIVNNVNELDLGENLRSFKHFTQDFSPALRGDQIHNYEFLKRIHNSFARKMDMLNADLFLKGNATEFNKKRRRKSSAGTEEAAYHFIAFVPVEGKVWQLDGLQHQPVSLESTPENGSWVDIARPYIQTQMEQYEDDSISFGLLALVKDPISHLRSNLAQNIRAVNVLETRLKELVPDRKPTESSTCTDSDPYFLTGPNSPLGITEDLIAQSCLPPHVETVASTEDSATLLVMHQDLAEAQSIILANLKRELDSQSADEIRAANRRWDYGPFIRKWLQITIQNGSLKEILEEQGKR